MSQRQATKAAAGIVGWAVALALAVFFVGGPLSLVLPFEPYRLADYRIVPTVACPGQPVTFVFARGMARQPLSHIPVGDPDTLGDEAILTHAQWVNADTGKRLEPETYPTDFTGKYGTRTGESQFQRFAPNEPGRWYQDVTVTVTGRQALRPVTQTVPTFQTDPVRVLPFGAPACR